MYHVQGEIQPYYDVAYDDRNDHPKIKRKVFDIYVWFEKKMYLTGLLNQSGGGGDDDDDDDENDFESDRGKFRCCWLLYFIGLFEFVIVMDELAFVVIDGGTSEFDEADFLNSLSFVREGIDVIWDDVGEIFNLFDWIRSCDFEFEEMLILVACIGNVGDGLGWRGDKVRGIRTFLWWWWWRGLPFCCWLSSPLSLAFCCSSNLRDVFRCL